MQNALGTQLGYPSNRSKAGGVFGYLLNDNFTTNRSAGAVNGTNAEPGPGVRTVADTNSKLSLSGGAVAFATGGVGNGDPGLWYAARSRTSGVLCHAQFQHTAGGVEIGWDSTPVGGPTDSVRINGTSLQVRAISGSALVVGAVTTSTSYQVAVPLRATGAFYFIKGGTFTNWTLLYVGNTGTYTPIPAVVATGNTSVATVDYIRVPSARWLPTPLASDSFATWGTTNGLGHAESTGIGSGGSGETWTDNVGTWAASGTAAASAVDGGIAIATVDTSTADVIAIVKVTRSAGNAGLVVRYADTSNYVYALHNGTNAQLIKVVAGTPTTLINAAATYSAGAELRVICDVTKFRLYYNNALVGSEQTISDSGLASGTKQGLYTSDTGNTFDDCVFYARGTGGEYAALDDF
jgi:hypothetical protein